MNPICVNPFERFNSDWAVVTWTAAYQAPPSMGFSRQKYWSGDRHSVTSPPFSHFLALAHLP